MRRAFTVALGVFFIFLKTSAQAPGGVTGGTLWLKANTGVTPTTNGSTLTAWTTQMGTTSPSGGAWPIYRLNSTDNVNYNPVVDFNGTSHYLNINNALGLTSNTATVFSVLRMASGAAGNDAILGSQTNTANSAQFYISNASAPYALTISRQGSSTVTSANSIAATTPTIATVRRNGNTSMRFWFDGTGAAGTTFNNNFVSVNKRLGSSQQASNTWFLAADLAEVIVYSTSLADYQVQNIHSYLALKYGITISEHNYYASDWNGTTGTTFWNRTTNTGFNSNIAGIGRDDGGGGANTQLVQKQSRSINTAASGDLVVMGLNAIAANNGANAGSFSANRSFLVWGDNGGANAWQSTETPAANRQRLTREWRVQETGTVGSVVVRVSDNSATSGGELPTEVGTVYLLVDADGNFSSGATSVAMTLSGSNWEANYDFSDGQYFTFATGVSGYMTLTNLGVSSCIDHPLQDVATMSVKVDWENAPSGDTIEVSIYGKTERVFVAAGAVSPDTLYFTFQADGTSGNSITGNWRGNPTLYTATASYNAPASCSSDSINCKVLYLCGLDKPNDGDAWDHGFMNYVDAVNGTKTVTAILTKNDALGMGTYDPDNPTTFVNVTLTDYDLIIVSATTEGSIATDLVNALKNFTGSVMLSNYDIVDNMGYSNSAGGYQYQSYLYIDNSTSKEIYNYNNIYSTYSNVFTHGDPVTGGDDYLWTNAGDEAAFINSAYFVYDVNDALPGVSSGHGRRVYLGYHMNGVYMNPQNGGAMPAPAESYFNPAKHLTLDGKTYFDQALVAASLSCVVEICVNSVDDNGDGLVDCADPDCPGISFTPQPPNDTMCFAAAQTLTVVATGGTGLTYQWQYNSGSWSNVVNGTPTNASYTGSTTASLGISGNIPDGSYQFRVTVSNSVGCTGISNTTTLLVRNTVANAGPDVTQCSNATFTLAANSPAGYTGTWTVASGTASIANPSSATSSVTLTTTNATLVWTLTSAGCTDTDTVSLTWIHVFVLASNNSPFCPGSAINLYAAPDGYTTYAWTGPNSFVSALQNPVIYPSNSTHSGTYTVTVTDSNGCQSNTSTSVTVYGAPATPGVIGY